MRTFASTGRRASRGVMIAAVFAAAVGLGSAAAAASPARSAMHPAVKPATSCTDSWKTATSGAWSISTNWSNGNVPTSTDSVCITVRGTYTVTLVGDGFAGTLTLGGASGTQTLTVEGNASSGGILDLSTLTGSDVKKHGVLALDSEDVSGASSAQLSNGGTSGVTLTNDGTFETLGGSVSDDYIDTDLTNDSGGKVSIGGANTEEEPYANITNNGTFTITTGGNFSVVGGSQATTTFTDSGGTLDNKGTLSLNDVTFTQSGGKLSGDTVAVSDGSTLNDSAGGGSFSFEGTDSLSGTIPAGQTITLLGTPSSGGSINLSGNVTNDGTFILDSENVSGAGPAQLANGGTTGLTFTNNGTFKTIGATVSSDEIAVDLTNDSGGTVTISGASTTGAAYANITNNGSFTVTSSGSLAITGGSEATTTFTDSGGTLVDNGSVSLNSAVFAQSGGVESGKTVALTDTSTLTDSAGGGNFSMVEEDFLSGTIPVGQTLTVLGTASDNSLADLTTNVTDDGTLILDSENVSGAGYAEYEGGPLTVNGTLETLGATINDDVIGAALTIDPGGLVSINGPHNLANSDNFINNDGGTLAIGDFGNLSLTNDAAYNSTSQSTYAVTLDPNDAIYPFIGDTNQQGFSGTLQITTVGSVAGDRFGLVGGDENTVGEDFDAFNFGTEAFDVTTGADGSAIYATSATPFALAGHNITETQGVQFKHVTLATLTVGSQAGATYTASINWGDGTAASVGTVTGSGSTLSIEGTHTYTEACTCTVTTTVSDQLGTTKTVTSSATVSGGAGPRGTTLAETFGLGSIPAAASPAHPAVKPATSCTDSWETATSGAWSTATNWSTGSVPTSTSKVCITAPGTYTVTLVGDSPAGTLTLGGASGTQTLSVQGNSTSSGVLELSIVTGSVIKKNGVLALDSQDVSGAGYAEVDNDGTSGVTLTNDGTFETLDASVGDDYVDVDLTNDSVGKVSIGGANTIDSDANITNNGSFTVTSSGSLAITGNTFTDSGGTLGNEGTLSLNGVTFTQSGGNLSGNAVAVSDFSTLNDSAGRGSFSLEGDDSLSGTIPTGQTVTQLGTPSSGGTTNLTGNVTNDGTFILDSENVSGASSAELSNDGTSGVTFINNGTFKAIGATVSSDEIAADLTNDSGGTVTISGASTTGTSVANITNNGSFTVTSGANLAITGSTFTDSGGTLGNEGTLSINGVTFTQSGGNLSGNAVAVSDFSTLIDSAGGGSFSLEGNNSLSGTIPTGQTITVLGTPSSGGTLVLNDDVTNDGTLIFDSENVSGASSAELSNGGTAGLTLANNGIFKMTGATVSSDEIAADLTNDSGGAVTISGTSTTGSPVANITNNGTFTVTSAANLAITGSTFTDSGGTLVDNGSVSLNEATFVQSGGVESGKAVGLTDTSTLTDSAGGGSFSMTQEDFLSGTIPVGQTITVLGTASDNSTADLTTNVTDDGTLILDSENVSGAGYAQYIGGQLTVNGTLETLGATINDDVIGDALTIDPGGQVTINGPHNLANSSTYIDNDGGTFTISDGSNISMTNNAAYDSSSSSTFHVTLDPNNAVYPFIGDASQQAFAGTLEITTVGAADGGGIVGGDAVTVNDGFDSYNFGPDAYNVAVGSDGSTIVATAATPFSLSGHNFNATEGIAGGTRNVATITPGSQPGATYTAMINWGDGTGSTTGTVTASGANFKVTGHHTYSETCTCQVTTTVSDTGPGTIGTTKSVFSTATVTAGATQPTVTSVRRASMIRDANAAVVRRSE